MCGMGTIEQMFAGPSSLYRGKPFWAWNGRLEESALRRQIRVFSQMGMGGFFMHSRVGLATAYLSDEWFEMIRACIDEAEKLGMEAWLYDEDRWPSGAAGGLVTRDEKYRLRRLRMTIYDPLETRLDEEPLAVFSAAVDGNRASDIRRLQGDFRSEEIPAGHRILTFLVQPDDPSPWYNNYTYLDTMNHQAMKRFLEVTHERYAEQVGQWFGGVVPGIFTDEPNHGDIPDVASLEGPGSVGITWTPSLPQTFQERYGYDILDRLPELFYQVDGAEVSQVCYHYHDCKTFLFVDAFSRQLGEWCEANNLMHTGHVLKESGLHSQTEAGGSAMRFYEHMHAPGIDILTEHWYELGTAKQCSSVARQTGRRWMLSELYGCTGWDFNFEAHKAVGDWQAALGVNLRCQHLSWFTMAGEAKRDYPASIHFQSPWWPHYRKVEDYFARVGVLMSRGEPVRKLLVVHPVEGVWTRPVLGWWHDRGLEELEEQFSELRQWLLETHLDFDYADEEMLSRIGVVEAHQRRVLRVGQAHYEGVVVPPLITVRSSTLRLLDEFRQAGGQVIFCGQPPRFVDGKEASEDALRVADSCVRIPYRRPDLVEAAGECARVINVADADGTEKGEVLYQLRREDERLYLFMCNTDRSSATGPLTVTVKGQGSVQLWDAETGRRFAVDARPENGAVTFETDMAASGSRLFVIDPGKESLPPLVKLTETRSQELPEERWSSQLAEPNVLVLDRPSYRIGRGKWEGPSDILRVDRAVRRELGLTPRGGAMVQPWAREKAEGPSTGLELRYEFDVDELPGGPLHLALEQPERLRVHLNGRPVRDQGECGWWVDPCIRLLPLDAALLRRGQNELTVSTHFDENSDLETIFVLGDFSAKAVGDRAAIAGPLRGVAFGDWTEQGLPFYGGSVVFRTSCRLPGLDGERIFVEVPEFAGGCVRVLVNGQEAGIIGWRPHEVDITPLAEGREEVELSVEVISHRRNCFGPLHVHGPKPDWVGPEAFVTEGEQWQDEYDLVPCGLLSAPRLSFRQEA